MIEPALKDEAFLADVREPLVSPSEFRLWWLGQSGYLVKWIDPLPDGGLRHMLIDPYLSDSLTVKYAATDKPHIRMSARVVDPARLDFIDVVTSSHNHTGHLDAETIRPLLARSPEIVVPAANVPFVAQRLGLTAETLSEMNEGDRIHTYGPSIVPVASAHETLDIDAQGQHRFLGYVFDLLDGRTIYHSGDTILYEGLIEKLRPFDIDIALLPINGRTPERRVAGNLNGAEAARLAKDIGAKIVIPCHYDMFEFNTADPADEFIPECERIGQKYRVLRQGERWSSDELT